MFEHRRADLHGIVHNYNKLMFMKEFILGKASSEALPNGILRNLMACR